MIHTIKCDTDVIHKNQICDTNQRYFLKSKNHKKNVPMKRYPSCRLVFDRRKRSSKTKKGAVELEVLYLRKRKWYSTGISVYQNQWSDKTKVKASLQMIEMNERLDMILSSAVDYINNIIQTGEDFDFQKFERNVIQHEEDSNCSFITFIKNRIEERNDLKAGTLRNHEKLLSSLESFNVIRSFSDLTKGNIALYDDFLHKQGYKQTTVYDYHKLMKRYINEALRYELINNSPYDYIRIDRGKFDGIKYLVREDVVKLMNLELDDDMLIKTRDLFIFQCFTGLSYSDMVRFDFSKVEEREENYYIRDNRIKTDEEYFIMLLSPAINILKRYDFKLPIISNTHYKLRLKVLQSIAKIKTTLHTHVARHTFAVMALNMGVSIENLAKMMGHADIKTTQVYAKVLNTSVQSEFEKMQERINNM